MIDLQEIITSTLPEESVLEQDPLRAIREEQEVDGLELIRYIDAAEKALQEKQNIWQSVATVLVRANQSYYTSPEEGQIKFLLQAHLAEQGKPSAIKYILRNLQSMREDVEASIAWDIKFDTLSDIYSSIQFLGDILNNDLLPVLKEITGAKETTVQKWIQGSAPSSQNSLAIKRLAEELYDAREEGTLEEKLNHLCRRKKA